LQVEFLAILIKVNSAERLTYRFSVLAPNFRSLRFYKISLHQRKTCNGVAGLPRCITLLYDFLLVIMCAVVPLNQCFVSFSETFRKIVIFGILLKIPKNTRFNSDWVVSKWWYFDTWLHYMMWGCEKKQLCSHDADWRHKSKSCYCYQWFFFTHIKCFVQNMVNEGLNT